MAARCLSGRLIQPRLMTRNGPTICSIATTAKGLFASNGGISMVVDNGSRSSAIRATTISRKPPSTLIIRMTGVKPDAPYRYLGTRRAH